MGVSTFNISCYCSEHGGTESVFMADKGFDEPGWGTFDTSYDTDAASEFTHVTKVSDRLL